MGLPEGAMGNNEPRTTGRPMEENWRKTPGKILEVTLESTTKAYGGDDLGEGTEENNMHITS